MIIDNQQDFGRGCNPRPAKKSCETFRTGLQTPSGKGPAKETFRTGLQTPSGKGPAKRKHFGRGCKPRPAKSGKGNISDGVANPVRQKVRQKNPVRQKYLVKHFGRGCKPRPAKSPAKKPRPAKISCETFRTGLQTPSGKKPRPANQLSIINCQLSIVNCQLSIVNCQLSIINYQFDQMFFQPVREVNHTLLCPPFGRQVRVEIPHPPS